MSVQTFIAIDVEIFQSRSQLQAVYSSLDLHIFRLSEEIQAETLCTHGKEAKHRNGTSVQKYNNCVKCFDLQS